MKNATRNVVSIEITTTTTIMQCISLRSLITNGTYQQYYNAGALMRYFLHCVVSSPDEIPAAQTMTHQQSVRTIRAEAVDVYSIYAL
jgi:hypothetical protein